VNHLFESAAVTYGRGTIAVVLSGSGNDGAEGVRVVRDAGGVVIVQEPDSALFAGMPEAAINTGIAAYVLPCAEIARLLVALARGDHPVESAFAHAPVA
jgi:chemotaxis response regulator CheB